MTTPIINLPLPPVPSAQTLDDRGSIISQPWQQWFNNARDKINALNATLINIGKNGVSWGTITGTLSSQTDLTTSLNGKAGLSLANVFTQQQAVTPYRANISGAVSIDLTAAAKSNNLHLTLTGNVTSFALTNPVDGAVYNIRFIQDSTGGRTVSGLSPSFKFSGGTSPVFSTAANSVDFMSLQYGGVEATYMCSFLHGMS